MPKPANPTHTARAARTYRSVARRLRRIYAHGLGDPRTRKGLRDTADRAFLVVHAARPELANLLSQERDALLAISIARSAGLRPGHFAHTLTTVRAQIRTHLAELGVPHYPLTVQFERAAAAGFVTADQPQEVASVA